MVLSSQSEGGANCLSEAIVCSVPSLCSEIDGSVGMLGEDYPGYFPTSDERALADLLHRAETDPVFYQALQERTEELRPFYQPSDERGSWERLIAEF